MSNLIAAAVFWIVTHLGISSSALRVMLVKQFGERAYLRIYSFVAFGALSYLIYSYSRINIFEYLWVPSPMLHWVAFLLMPIALILLAGSFTTTNPTIVGQDYKLAAIGEGAGMIRITRHPFQWAVIIWAIVHVLTKGTIDALIFFGAFVFVSLVGTVLMDKKKLMQLGDVFQSYIDTTSNVPFVAIIQGRNRLCLSELSRPVVIGLSLYFLLLWGHQFVFGVSLF